MNTILELIQTDTVAALITSVFIFIVTLFLVIKRWVGFSTTFLLLVFSIASGLAISNHRIIEYYVEDYKANRLPKSNSSLKEQISHAVKEVENEVTAEKENLHHLTNQMTEIFEQLEVQKHKLQSFITETQDRIKSEKIPLTHAQDLNSAGNDTSSL